MCKCKESLFSFLQDKKRTFEWEATNLTSLESRIASLAKLSFIDEILSKISKDSPD